MCLSCGFDGRSLQSEHRETGWVCPRCGTDLYSRPPRSYADLEGLSDSSRLFAAEAAAHEIMVLQNQRAARASRRERAMLAIGLMALAVVAAGLLAAGVVIGVMI